MAQDFLDTLFEANRARNKFWDPEGKLNVGFFALEHAGEVGEVCNNIKKLWREQLGLKGSHVSEEQVLSELADDLITFALLCDALDFTPAQIRGAVQRTFNKKSKELSLPVMLHGDL